MDNRWKFWESARGRDKEDRELLGRFVEVGALDDAVERAKQNLILRDFGIMISVSIPFMALASVWAGDPFWRRAVLVAIWLCGHLASEIFRNRGQLERAGAALAVAGWMVVSGVQWWSGGMESPIAGGQSIVIIGAALVGGSRAAALRLACWIMALSLANCAAMWVAGAQGWAPEPTLARGWMGMFSQHFTILSLTALMMWATLGKMGKAADAAKEQRGKALLAAESFKSLFMKSDAPMGLAKAGSGAGMAANEAFQALFEAGSDVASAIVGDQSAIWEDADQLGAALAELAEGREARGVKARMRSLGGKGLTCVVGAKAVVWEGMASVLWTYQDVTANEELGARLAKLNAELEDRVVAKASELASVQRELERRERLALLGEMVAGVAHEVNTPLGNALLSASSIAEPGERIKAMAAEGKLSRSELAKAGGRIVEAASIAVENLGRAAEVIKNFKQLSADQAGQARRSFEAEAVVAGAMRAMGPAFKEAGVSWEVEATGEAKAAAMDGYPGALSQIATVLGSNAILHAFGAEGAGKLFKARLEVPKAGWLRVVFSDNGSGLPPGSERRIFEPFYTTKGGQGGTGLGLAIAWNLARDALGGELGLEPGADHSKGCRFELMIPMSSPRPGLAKDSGGAGALPSQALK